MRMIKMEGGKIVDPPLPLVRGLTFENIVTPESLSLMNDFGHTKVMVEQIISGSNTS